MEQKFWAKQLKVLIIGQYLRSFPPGSTGFLLLGGCAFSKPPSLGGFTEPIYEDAKQVPRAAGKFNLVCTRMDLSVGGRMTTVIILTGLLFRILQSVGLQVRLLAGTLCVAGGQENVVSHTRFQAFQVEVRFPWRTKQSTVPFN